MGKITGISWTDHTWNPVRGCTKVSAGCAHCYAERDSKWRPALRGVWGDAGTRVVAAERSWREVLEWDREARQAGARRRVFCASLADWLEDWRGPVLDHKGRVVYVNAEGAWFPGVGKLPPGPPCRPLTYADVRARLLDTIARTPNLDWLLLSKRPENWDRLMREAVASVPGSNGHLDGGVALGSAWLCGDPPRNVVVMTTCEDQENADLRLPQLLAIPAARRGISVEPQLGPVDLVGDYEGDRENLGPVWTGYAYRTETDCGTEYDEDVQPGIDWVITGGESGPGARPFDLAWARSLRDQCALAGIPYFVKQLGDNPVCDGQPFPAAGRHGTDPELWPEDLRIQEFYPDLFPV